MEILAYLRTFNKIKRVLAVLASGLLFSLAVIQIAQAETDERKYKIEAAFLYNFFNYIAWPEGKAPGGDKVATVCVYNNSLLEDALHYVEAQKSAERQLKIMRVSLESIPSSCHIVFIGRTKGDNAEKIKELLTHNTAKALLVSDRESFLEEGGMIGLVQEKERITFDINNTLLSRSGFQVSSRLLSLARDVE